MKSLLFVAVLAVGLVAYVKAAGQGERPDRPDNSPSTVVRGRLADGFPNPGDRGLIIQSLVFTDTDNNRQPEGQENQRQCNNGDTGWKWDWLGDLTKPIRVVTDWRWGGCDWMMTVIDSGNKFTGSEFRIVWGNEVAAGDGDPKRWTAGSECGYSGTYVVEMTQAIPRTGWSLMRRIGDNHGFIRIDTDSRLGACPIQFQVYREPKDKVVEWLVRLENPGQPNDSAICGTRPKSPADEVAVYGKPLSYVMNPHDGQGCEMRMQLLAYRAYTVEAGDTLRQIAAKKLGSAKRWEDIAKLNKNRLANPEVLKVGSKLKLPS